VGGLPPRELVLFRIAGLLAVSPRRRAGAVESYDDWGGRVRVLLEISNLARNEIFAGQIEVLLNREIKPIVFC
jgi:hypothetical protein